MIPEDQENMSLKLSSNSHKGLRENRKKDYLILIEAHHL